MRGRRSIIASLGAAALVGVAVSGAGAQGDEPMSIEEPFHIGYFAALTGHDWAQVGFEAAKDAVESYGGTIELFDAQFDAGRQYAQIQDATASNRFDGYIIMVQDGASVLPAVEEAVEAGIKVVDYAFAVGTDLDTREPQVPGMTGSVVLSYTENGQQIADIATLACADVEPPCKVALLPGSLSVAADATRIQVVQEVLEAIDDIEVVAVAETGYTVDGAYGVAKDILTANPDLAVFAAIGSEGVNGAERAVEEAGLAGQVKLGGGGCSKNATDAVREGRLFACYRGTPIDDNRAAVDLIVAAIQGEPIEDVSPNAAELAGWPPIVTADTIGDLEGQWND